MSAVFDIADGAPIEPPDRQPPQVLSRVFTVPAGAPWEQARAAQLEVRHGSPLAISELIWRLRRLDGWRPGQPSRYAVFYIRSREYVGPFETTVEIDGDSVKIAFGTASDGLRRAKQAGVAIAIAAAVAATLATGVGISLHAKATAVESLDSLERTAKAKVRLATKVQRQRAQGRELRAAVGNAGRVEDVLDDLAWATSAKAPTARISALHWDHGLLAVEARGDAPPFLGADRSAEKSVRPLRTGVWLWGVRPASADAARTQPQ